MLTIVGFVAIVVFTYQVYKTAASTARNPVIWSVVTAMIGIGFQFILPLLIGIVLAIYYVATGTPTERLQDEISGIALIIGLISLVISIVGMAQIMKHVSKVKDDDPVLMAPPPPPNFS